MRDKIFISYSHKDAAYQLRLRTHLTPFERKGMLRCWADTKIQAGDVWQKEIKHALEETIVAIILISADFLASDFIANNELPPLLDAYENEGVKIIPILLKPCAIEISGLQDYQCINDLKNPLSAMNETDQELLWTSVAKTAYEYCKEFSLFKNFENMPELFQKNDDALTDIFYEKYSTNEHESMYESNIHEFLEHLLNNPDNVMDYYVYNYEHIDVLDFLPKVDMLAKSLRGFDRLMDKVQILFKSYGWEGDGNIRFMWFPPFMDVGVEDTWGTLTFFVKQLNNGEAFIASPVPLNFKRLISYSWCKKI